MTVSVELRAAHHELREVHHDSVTVCVEEQYNTSSNDVMK